MGSSSEGVVIPMIGSKVELLPPGYISCQAKSVSLPFQFPISADSAVDDALRRMLLYI